MALEPDRVEVARRGDIEGLDGAQLGIKQLGQRACVQAQHPEDGPEAHR
jgi:hypothetical protein